MGYLDYEKPQLGDWKVGTTETYIFKDDKLFVDDEIEDDVRSINSKKSTLGFYVLITFDNPNQKKYITQTYSKMD